MRAIVAGSGSVDRKSTRLNSSHSQISYAAFCLKKKRVSPPRAVADCVETQRHAPLRIRSDGRGVSQRLYYVAAELFVVNAAAATCIYTLSLHDALPIFPATCRPGFGP